MCLLLLLVRNLIFAKSRHALIFAANSLNLANSEYVECLIPKDHGDTGTQALMPGSVVCMAKLSLLSLSDQIQVILKDGKFTLVLESKCGFSLNHVLFNRKSG